ncbi:very long chain fatty acid elongase 7 [Helicoverpa armigera]|uniref:very long chain fatty acid elongase 7 n=1 Tax=Helicoverpa armigera TaxID=29058 RepID=UPI000B395A91|nr:elongation of very long chain fatty acids protein 7 [Helicoverpa armigera]XP_021181994.1 elongation of very long chain fatty acids protein 7 [Helicoverpa armigera]XP_021181996.1 elongation of very long chain fatty acids protein 7 [Helicoverpa armigera]XP_021181999.1 elongation of very long chain fatty acids protein 7 [Helicoverpa armigera]XP_047020623.1 elongation of very long chain fatty acids protein 7-like [Helicoverpa zea]XP_047020624.1 elongation of very long chain fatty acids protein 
MNSVIGLSPKNPSWDLNKSKYEEIDELPFMASLGPVLTILAVYLVFVLKIGPVFMRKREGYKLTHTLLIYNAIQVAISVYMVYRFFIDLIHMGLVPKKCYMNEDNSRNRILFGTYLYLSAKLSELLDTVFFVLRKKTSQITFLHLYHHTVMVIGTWALLKYWPSHTLIFIGFLNSLVHVFMYTYYGLAALGPNVAKYLWWKKYMTKFQLIQFVSIIIQYVATVRVSECPPARGVAIFVSCNTGVILLLFLNFYRQNYNKRRGGIASKLSIPAVCLHKED